MAWGHIFLAGESRVLNLVAEGAMSRKLSGNRDRLENKKLESGSAIFPPKE